MTIVLLIASPGCTPSPAPIAQDNTCKFGLIADYPVVLKPLSGPVITMNIEGHDEHMMVDSGASDSLLTGKAYGAMNRFFLDTNFTDIESVGVAGAIEIRKETNLNVRMGPQITTNATFLISDKMLTKVDAKAGIDGVIGNNILDQYDEAYDFPHHTLGFYGTLNCPSPLTPWVGDFAVVPLAYASNGSAGIPYLINGHSLVGIIDTGTERTFVTKRALDRARIKPAAIDNVPGYAVGYGGYALKVQIERFQSVELGAEDFADPWLRVGDTPFLNVADVIIAEDFLAEHRVFVDNFNAKAYLGLTIPPGADGN